MKLTDEEKNARREERKKRKEQKLAKQKKRIDFWFKRHHCVYVGTLIRILPTLQTISHGKAYNLRRAMLALKPEDEQYSSLIINLPDNFDIEKVAEMIGMEVCAHLFFKTVQKSNNYYNIINCYSIAPTDRKSYHLAQRLFDSRRKGHIDVDENGYASDYNS